MSFISRIQRVTSSTSFIPEIDGLRFFAIFTVVVFHLNTAFSRQLGLPDLGLEELGGKDNFFQPAWWIIRLDLGVKVFFSISGFVLALPFLKQYLGLGPAINLRSYYLRRLTRLEPPFVLSLLFFMMVHHFVMEAEWGSLLPSLGAGLLYAHVLFFGEPSPINPVTWSLETEAQFYLLVPLLFTFFFAIRKAIWRIVALVMFSALAIWFKAYTFYNGLGHVGSTVLAFGTHFLTGILVAYLYLTRPALFKERFYWHDLTGVVALIGLFVFYKPQAFWLNNVLFNTCTFTLMFSAFRGRIFNRFFTWSPIYLIGGMCYSIYLLHYAFFHLWVKIGQYLVTGWGYKTDLIIQMLAGIPVVVLVSAVFFVIVEKPCMDKDWPKRLIFRLRGIKKAI
jgi:peptidoglycan/LPS O-acetylase OafA/YrhL